jgi:type IV pilus assembly protein PilO
VQLFQPNAETLHDFYAERPISVRMLGDYHQFGEFVSGYFFAQGCHSDHE